jgi:cell division protein FtsZ
MMFEFVEENEHLAEIKVIGIGGAGGNAVNRMIEAGLNGVDFLAVNTDVQALRQSRAHTLQVGCQLTRGLGSGGDPRIGRKAVEEDEQSLTELLQGCDMVFVTAGMGGGTGTGAAPVIARIAREMGVLTVGIVTKPFIFEGAVRLRQAEEGITALREAVDTLIIIPNQRLLEVVPPNTSVSEAFRIADNVLYEATRGIHDIIARPNAVNLDFADVRAVMKGMGVALMGTGRAEGEDRAVAAAQAAISSPLLEDVNIHGAKGVLVNLLAAEIGISEISDAMSLVQEAAGSQAHIIFGYGTDESLGNTLQVTVIATGFRNEMVDQQVFGSRSYLSGEHPRTRAASLDQDVPLTPCVEGSRTESATAGVLGRESAARVSEETSTASRFLTPVAVKNLAVAEERASEPLRSEKRPSGGFRSDAFADDLSEPAYTRKYMD